MNDNKTSAEGIEWDLTDLCESKDYPQLRKYVETGLKGQRISPTSKGAPRFW
ncbi:MAG: hypothetical protein ACE5J6_03580 [Candidatus Bathyarchaeia archaeon]